MTSSHKKKVLHQKPILHSSPSFPTTQPPFLLEPNHHRNVQQNPRYLDLVCHEQSTRSSSTESSASSTSTLMHVDHFSSTPVVIPTKFFYRRR